jgi:hypothetical protein
MLRHAISHKQTIVVLAFLLSFTHHIDFRTPFLISTTPSTAIRMTTTTGAWGAIAPQAPGTPFLMIFMCTLIMIIYSESTGMEQEKRQEQ